MCGTFNVYITEYQVVFEFDSIIHEQRNKQYKPFENKIVLYLKTIVNFSTIKAIFHKKWDFWLWIIHICFNINLKVIGLWASIMSDWNRAFYVHNSSRYVVAPRHLLHNRCEIVTFLELKIYHNLYILENYI